MRHETQQNGSLVENPNPTQSFPVEEPNPIKYGLRWVSLWLNPTYDCDRPCEGTKLNKIRIALGFALAQPNLRLRSPYKVVLT
ncbi:hypothetical protein [Scytonema sp. NUACC21]